MGDQSETTRKANEVVGSMDPSGLLEGLETHVCLAFQSLLLLAATQGFGRLRVICARRSYTHQVSLYGHGRTQREMEAAKLPKHRAKPGVARVTNALPWESRHCQGLAMDVNIAVYDQSCWPAFGKLVKICGLTWGGGFRIRDYGHIEHTG